MMHDQKLTIEQSAALLHAIFPAYPVLLPCNPTPPREAWGFILADNRLTRMLNLIITESGA
jgi:aminopeptidase-like protein